MKRRVKSTLIMISILSLLLISVGIIVIINNTKDKNNNIDISCYVVNVEDIYLSVNESIPFDKDVEINENILKLENNVLTGISPGKCVIEIGECDIINIVVTDLYDMPTLNNNKVYLKDNTYSKDDNVLLDNALMYHIDKAGFKTRAGALEAVRFLLLRFKYNINYFYENGRLEKDYDDICDGEGRYYHYGLYLNDDKYKGLSKSIYGPAYWGKDLYSYEVDTISANGLDCSGFISWALYNAGYDVGDIGAGPSDNRLDFSDLGEYEIIFDVDIDKLKVGDLVGFDGHVAMIIGKDDKNVYVGEAFWENGLQVKTYEYDEFIYDSDWEYVMYMDSFYGNDGNLNNMW